MRNAFRLAVFGSFLAWGVSGGEIKPSAAELDIGGAPFKREEVFEFSQEPVFRNAGKDQYEISFASKGWCDVN